MLILLTYINRSGSTFLANQLSKFDEILVCPEAEILVKKYLARPSVKFKYDHKTKSNIKKLIETDRKLKYWGYNLSELSGLENAKNNYEVFIEFLNVYKKKTKPESKYILFKETRIINCYKKIQKNSESEYHIYFLGIVRDIRGTFASQSTTRSPSTNKIMESNPVFAARKWNQFINKVIKFNANDDFFLVHYESLIKNVVHEIGQICSFLGMEYNPEILKKKGDLYFRIPENYREIHQDIQQVPLINNISTWKVKLSPSEIRIIETISGSKFELLHYPLLKPEVNYMRFSGWFVFLNFKYFLKLIYGYLLRIIKDS